MPQSTLQIILEYVWVPLLTGLVLLWSKMVGIDVRASLLEQAAEHHRQQRAEEKKLRDEQRKEIMTRMDKNHVLVIAKLEEVDKRVKNGH